MNIRILFPRCLVVIVLFTLSGTVSAQTATDARPNLSGIRVNGTPGLETEPSAPLVTEEARPRTVSLKSKTQLLEPTINVTTAADRLLLAAIQSHLGAPYHFNRTGPDSFDCSGLVWRAFQDIGVNFQRGPARSYWATFEAPAKGDQFKFGTLVFFSNLSHVGIVVDEKGFYHSARHGGVMYSPFNDYWLSRIDGFRRVPVELVEAAGARTIAAENEQP